MRLVTTNRLQQEETELRQVIHNESLFPVFQPIVDLQTGLAMGYEALIRGPETSRLHSPMELFSAALRHGLLHPLELLCRKRALERFAQLKPEGKLFLNVTASLLSSPDHQSGFTADLLRQLGLSLNQIVIELSEQHPFDRQGLSLTAVQHYREMGFRIAIDDLGAGYSGLKLWSEIQPDYVKIDKHFVQGVDSDPVKREFVRSICNVGRSLRCMIIAEGIETLEEMRALQALGVQYGQGYLLGMPLPEPSMILDAGVIRARPAVLDLSGDTSETALSLVCPVDAMLPEDTIRAAGTLFREQPEWGSIPVLSESRPVGVVRRSDLLELFSTQYGRSLFEHKPVSRLMRRDPMIVESNTRLEDVSRLLTDQNDHNLQQDLVIVQDGCYIGMGSVRDLLKRITELKIQNARYANPLTLLPGNVPINRKIDALLQAGMDFRVAYFDLNHFKPFNDRYGYSRGDQVIRLLGELLVQHAERQENFIGHVGGDDFVVIFRSHDWKDTCEEILRKFEQQVRSYYTEEDLKLGGFQGVDRMGQSQFCPLLGLAVGVVHPDPLRCSSFHEISEMAAQAKKEAKQQSSSCIFESRRRTLNS
ncbi:GGDEF domain-containing protein [Nitrincola alkalilacustris]|uniref:GGDEF domain-containing protein n=1 Tax=Nitrincola alkalilacustris TaxID=1571224 RepID=UPI00124C23D3|nr:GGDEF domain-containing protein [Nitrincola alkalilacustris]